MNDRTEKYQKALDLAWDHFVTKKQPAGADPVMGCRLRGANGSKCAVGLLIPDAEYTGTMEAMPLYDLLAHGLVPGMDMDVYYFCSSLRNAHDMTTYCVASFEETLTGLADEFELTVPGSAS